MSDVGSRDRGDAVLAAVVVGGVWLSGAPVGHQVTTGEDA